MTRVQQSVSGVGTEVLHICCLKKTDKGSTKYLNGNSCWRSCDKTTPLSDALRPHDGGDRCVVRVGASRAVGQVDVRAGHLFLRILSSLPSPELPIRAEVWSLVKAWIGGEGGRGATPARSCSAAGSCSVARSRLILLSPPAVPRSPPEVKSCLPAADRVTFGPPSAGRCSRPCLSSPIPCRCPLWLAASSSQVPWMLAAVTSRQAPARAMPGNPRRCAA
jgi:hypothetical protein